MDYSEAKKAYIDCGAKYRRMQRRYRRIAQKEEMLRVFIWPFRERINPPETIIEKDICKSKLGWHSVGLILVIIYFLLCFAINVVTKNIYITLGIFAVLYATNCYLQSNSLKRYRKKVNSECDDYFEKYQNSRKELESAFSDVRSCVVTEKSGGMGYIGVNLSKASQVWTGAESYKGKTTLKNNFGNFTIFVKNCNVPQQQSSKSNAQSLRSPVVYKRVENTDIDITPKISSNEFKKSYSVRVSKDDVAQHNVFLYLTPGVVQKFVENVDCSKVVSKFEVKESKIEYEINVRPMYYHHANREQFFSEYSGNPAQKYIDYLEKNIQMLDKMKKFTFLEV